MGRKTVAVAVLLVHCVNRQMIVMHKTQTRNELMPLNASNCSPMYSDNPDACAQVLKYLYFKRFNKLLYVVIKIYIKETILLAKFNFLQTVSRGAMIRKKKLFFLLYAKAPSYSEALSEIRINYYQLKKLLL